MSKNFINILLLSFIFCGVVFAGNVLASAKINSVKLNGLDALSVNGGGKITATISVTLTEPSVWKSTAYSFGAGIWHCVDTPDHSGNLTYVEYVPMTAPSEQGTKKVNFEIYGNNDCTDGLDLSVAGASLLSAVKKVLASEDLGLWVAVFILVILAIVIFYIVKKAITKNKNNGEPTGGTIK